MQLNTGTMRTSLLLFLFSALLFSCGGDEPMTKEGAVRAACAKCRLNTSQMTWLSLKIKEAQEKPEKNGNFYAISTSACVVIVHQPVVMSCLGCVRFDCSGNTPTLSSEVISNEVVPG